MLVPVEVPRGAAQRVVLEDDAQVRARGSPPVTRDEGGLEPGNAGLHVEVVPLEIVGEDAHGALFLEAHFGVARDVVRHRQELPVHELPGACDDRVAARIASREAGDELRQGERALEIAHAAEHLGRGAPFSGCLLTAGARGKGGKCDKGGQGGKAHWRTSIGWLYSHGLLAGS